MLKKLLFLLCVLCVLCGKSSAQSTINFNFVSAFGTTNNRSVTITTPSLYGVSGMNLVLGVPRTIQPTNGAASTVLLPGKYLVIPDGFSQALPLDVPSGNNTYNAVDLINWGNLFAPPGFMFSSGTNTTIGTNYVGGFPVFSINANAAAGFYPAADGTTTTATTNGQQVVIHAIGSVAGVAPGSGLNASTNGGVTTLNTNGGDATLPQLAATTNGLASSLAGVSNTAAAAITPLQAQSVSNALAFSLAGVSNTAAAAITPLQAQSVSNALALSLAGVSNTAAAAITPLQAQSVSNGLALSLAGVSNTAAAAITPLQAQSISNALAASLGGVSNTAAGAVITNDSRSLNLSQPANTIRGTFTGNAFPLTNYATSNLVTTNLALGLSYTNYGGITSQKTIIVIPGHPYFYAHSNYFTGQDALIIVGTNNTDPGAVIITTSQVIYPTQSVVTFWNTQVTISPVGDGLFDVGSTNEGSYAGVHTGSTLLLDGSGLLNVPYAAVTNPPLVISPTQLGTASNNIIAVLATPINSASNAAVAAQTTASAAITPALLGTASNNIITVLATPINSASNAAVAAQTTASAAITPALLGTASNNIISVLATPINSASNAAVAAQAAATAAPLTNLVGGFSNAYTGSFRGNLAGATNAPLTMTALSDLLGWRIEKQLVSTGDFHLELGVNGDYLSGVLKHNGTIQLFNTIWMTNHAQVWLRAGKTWDDVAAATPVLAIPTNAGKAYIVGTPVYSEGGTNYAVCFYGGSAGFENNSTMFTGIWYSTDGTNWTENSHNPIWTKTGSSWYDISVYYGPIVKDDHGLYHLYLSALGDPNNWESTGHLESTNLLTGWTDPFGTRMALGPTNQVVNDLVTIWRRRDGDYAALGRGVGSAFPGTGTGASALTAYHTHDLTNWTYDGEVNLQDDTGRFRLTGSLLGAYGPYIFDDGGAPGLLTDDDFGSGVYLAKPDSLVSPTFQGASNATVAIVTPSFVQALNQTPVFNNGISTNLVPASLNYTNYTGQGVGQAMLSVTIGNYYAYYATPAAGAIDGNFLLQIAGTNFADDYAGDLYIDAAGGGLAGVQSQTQTNIIFRAAQNTVTFMSVNNTSGPVLDRLYQVDPGSFSSSGLFFGNFFGDGSGLTNISAAANGLAPSNNPTGSQKIGVASINTENAGTVTDTNLTAIALHAIQLSLGQENLLGFTNTVGNGQQPDLNIGTNNLAIITGNTAAISIPGIAGGSSNREVTLLFTAGFPVTFNNQSLGDSTATNRLDCTSDLTATGFPSMARLLYNPSTSRWNVEFYTGANSAANLTNAVGVLPPVNGGAQSGGTNLASATSVQIAFVTPFADTNYYVSPIGDGATLAAPLVTVKTTTNFTVTFTSFTGYFDWMAIHHTQ